MYKFRGELGVQYSIIALMKLGVKVYKPVVDSTPDLLIEWREEFFRVEVKTSVYSRNINSRIYQLTTTIHSNSHITATRYKPGTVDLFSLWTPDYPEHVCLIPFSEKFGKTFTMNYAEQSPKHPSINWYRNFLCAETLHHLSLREDKEKVQTTNR